MEEKKEPRTRTITAVKFEKNTKYDLKEFAKNLMQEYKGAINILAIRHDKDTKINEETGKTEKVAPHYHFFLESKNAKKISTWANILDVEPNIVRMVKSKQGAISYLTHRNNKEKAQYENKEVLSNYSKYEELIEKMEISNSEIYENIRKNGNKAILKYIDNIEISRIRTINALVGTRRLINAENNAFKFRTIAKKYMEMIQYIKILKEDKELTLQEFKDKIIERMLFDEFDLNELDQYINFKNENEEL